jgi:hypothetical protein
MAYDISEDGGYFDASNDFIVASKIDRIFDAPDISPDRQ